MNKMMKCVDMLALVLLVLSGGMILSSEKAMAWDRYGDIAFDIRNDSYETTRYYDSLSYVVIPEYISNTRVPDYHVELLSAATTNNRAYGLADADCAIGLSGDQYIVYNTTTKMLTIPGGNNFVMWKGVGMPHSTNTELDLSSVLVNDACIFYITSTGTIYAKQWNGCYADNMLDQMIGYYYRGNLHFNGVADSQIKVVSNDDLVYCFGDSLVAGYKTTKAFHMYWGDWTKNALFYNWGVGGTGYSTDYIGDSVSGDGIIGVDQAEKEQFGANTINSMINKAHSVNSIMNNIVIFGGTNDWGSSVDLQTFKKNVYTTLINALSKTTNILVIGPIKRENWNNVQNDAGLYLKDYSDAVKEQCDALGIIFVDGYEVALDPSISQNKNAYFQPDDGIHPNNLGHARIARHTFSLLQEAICK